MTVKDATARETRMAKSRLIAGLVGPSAVAATVSETINLGIWKTNLAPVTYLNGTLLLVAGIAIVRAHNRWTLGWPVLVTITGWVFIVGGLYRMFYPQAQQLQEGAISSYAFMGALFVAGCVMTFEAYGRGLWLKLFGKQAR